MSGDTVTLESTTGEKDKLIVDKKEYQTQTPTPTVVLNLESLSSPPQTPQQPQPLPANTSTTETIEVVTENVRKTSTSSSSQSAAASKQNKACESSSSSSDDDDDDDDDEDASSVASSSSSESRRQRNNNSIMCRICHCEETSEEYLIAPCYCSGTLRYVHQSCLQQWLKKQGTKSCELCKFEFIMQTRIRSLKNWEKLDINHIERRKILCSVTFHLIVITCVIWSLYVLIERTAHEMSLNQLDWAFWVKLIVVAIGFTGGVIFMYIQCKMYVQLCMRWRRYNRVIIIQPITEELLISNTNQRRAGGGGGGGVCNGSTGENNLKSPQQQQPQLTSLTPLENTDSKPPVVPNESIQTPTISPNPTADSTAVVVIDLTQLPAS